MEGFIHRLGRQDGITPSSPLSAHQHQAVIRRWNPSMAQPVSAEATEEDALYRAVEQGAVRIQLKASRGVRYEQPLSVLVRYSSLIREWVIAEGITLSTSATEATASLGVSKEEDGSATPESHPIKLAPMEDGRVEYALCQYGSSTTILRTNTLPLSASPSSTTEDGTDDGVVVAPNQSTVVCAINVKKPVAAFRIEMLVAPSGRPESIQAADAEGELMLDSQFLGIMFTYLKRFHKAQCEGPSAVVPPLPPLLAPGEGSDELLPGQKRNICQIIEVLGLWAVFEDVYQRFFQAVGGSRRGADEAIEPDRMAVEPAEDAQRREEDVTETAKLVQKTILIAKANELGSAGKGVATTSPSPSSSAAASTLTARQEHLEWVETFRNKVRSLRDIDSAFEDTKEARLRALQSQPRTAPQPPARPSGYNNGDDSSDDDGMSAMLLGVGCPFCGRQGHAQADCPYTS